MINNVCMVLNVFCAYVYRIKNKRSETLRQYLFVSEKIGAYSFDFIEQPIKFNIHKSIIYFFYTFMAPHTLYFARTCILLIEQCSKLIFSPNKVQSALCVPMFVVSWKWLCEMEMKTNKLGVTQLSV